MPHLRNCEARHDPGGVAGRLGHSGLDGHGGRHVDRRIVEPRSLRGHDPHAGEYPGHRARPAQRPPSGRYADFHRLRGRLGRRAGLHRHRLDRAFGALDVAKRGLTVWLANDDRSGRGSSLWLARPVSPLAPRTKRSPRWLGQPIQSARFQRQSRGPGRNDRYRSKQRFRQQRAVQRAPGGQHPTAPDRSRRLRLCEFQRYHFEPTQRQPGLRETLRPKPRHRRSAGDSVDGDDRHGRCGQFCHAARINDLRPGFLRAYLGGSTYTAATSRSNIVQFLRSEAGITLYLSSSGT